MKISRDVEIFIYRGVVIIFDFIFLSLIFLCAAFVFFFEGALRYSFFVGFVVFLVGIFCFCGFGVLFKRRLLIDELLSDGVSQKYCFFCWVLRIVGARS